jgi:hypothetical protein
VRGGVSFALVPLLAGAAFVISFVVAGVFDPWAYGGNDPLRPSDEMVGCMLAVAGAAYVVAMIWLWTRSRYRLNEFWKAGLLTIAVVVLTLVIAGVIYTVKVLRGAYDVLAAAAVCGCIATVILIWVQAGRRFARGKPLHTADGSVDVCCPSCGYRMVGLRESRCPECGVSYTLDELFQRQGFRARVHPLGTLPPPTVATEIADGKGTQR